MNKENFSFKVYEAFSSVNLDKYGSTEVSLFFMTFCVIFGIIFKWNIATISALVGATSSKAVCVNVQRTRSGNPACCSDCNEEAWQISQSMCVREYH